MIFRVSKTRNPIRRGWPTPHMPVDDVIDRLWTMALSVAMDDADAYETLRQAIAHLEQARHA